IDPGVKGGPRVERLVKTAERLVDQLGKRPREIDDHQVADQAEGWLAVGAHERAPTVISRRPRFPSGGGQGGAAGYHIKWATIGWGIQRSGEPAPAHDLQRWGAAAGRGGQG